MASGPAGHGTASGPVPSVVVATALIHDGRVLAARRAHPPALAGRWELPGGRVEPGETEPQAVIRECREELGIDVSPAGRLGPDVPLDTPSGALVLRAYLARPSHPVTPPRPLVHTELRWLYPGALDDVPWLDTDLALLPALRTALGDPHPSTHPTGTPPETDTPPNPR